MCVPAVDADVEVEVEDLLCFFFASGEGVHLHEKQEVRGEITGSDRLRLDTDHSSGNAVSVSCYDAREVVCGCA